MLLLWSRLAALGLAGTGGPVPASPLKALDNGLSIAPASRTEQVTNSNKRNISFPPTFDSVNSSIFLYFSFSPSQYTNDAGVNGAASQSFIIESLLSIGKTYHPGDMVPFKWDLPVSLKQADICIAYYGAVTSIPVCSTFGISLTTGRGGLVLPDAHSIPWKDVTGHEGINARVSAFLYFSFSPSQ